MSSPVHELPPGLQLYFPETLGLKNHKQRRQRRHLDSSESGHLPKKQQHSNTSITNGDTLNKGIICATINHQNNVYPT